MRLPYDLSADAEKDLKGIFRYTIKEWGHKQAKSYADFLESTFCKIAENKCVSRTFSAKYPDLLVTSCEHHYVFYLRQQERPLIIAVLHKRMDLVSRLQNRLESKN